VTKVKICGVNSAEALAAAADGGADWVGFVFYPPSPRALTPAQAAALSATRPGGPVRVGLFVDPADEEVEAALAALPLGVLQHHGDPARGRALRARFGLPVWQAVGVAGQADLPDREAGVDGLLLDAKAPADADLPGGNAQRFDWSVLSGWAAPLPWLLAGGLTPENVRKAVETAGAAAVDVSSGVERARGVKDPALIRAFVAAARGG